MEPVKPNQINDFPDQIPTQTYEEAVQRIESGLVSHGVGISPTKPIQSTNFVEGATGYRIDTNGDVEFNDGTFRGALSASTIDIGGSDATSFHVDIDGNLWLGDATFASAPFKVSNAGVLTATGATISGAITATSGAIGGFNIGTDYVRDAANSFGLASTVTGGDDVRFWAGDTFANRAIAPFRVTEAGAATASSFTHSGGTVGASVVVALGALNVAARGWMQTSVFSVTDADTVAWAAGTFTSADGTAYSIGGGNTGNMAAPTYIYLDTAVSTIAYQTTTTAATAVGAGKVLIAKAENGTGEATFQVFGGIGGTNINASSIVANSITANELATSITYAGSLIIDTAGLMRSGQTAYDTGTGWWIGNDGGTPKLSIGNSAGNKLTWNGTVLTITGALTASSIDIPDTTTANSFHVNTAGDTWWGATTFATALASISKAGLLTAVSLTSLNVKTYTCFETAARFGVALVNAGTRTFDTNGLTIDTNLNASASSNTLWPPLTTGGSPALFSGSPTFSAFVHCGELTAASGAASSFIGIGNVTVTGAGHTYTTDHCGFKFIKAAGVVTLYATQGDGTTETASAALTTVVNYDGLDLIIKIRGTTSIDYYWRKNAGTLSAATNLTTNLPNDATKFDTQFSVSNDATAFRFRLVFGGASFER